MQGPVIAQRLGAGLRADTALGGLVVLIVAMMVVPLPTALLDALIALNLGIGALMVLVALYSRGPATLTALPSVLLITTLYRLALNVSSTRLILLQADAGRVIEAFGSFVVRGDYLVGGVIFLILTLIQYLVIARGAERVAEVGARFSLDAMPGKQLAIDGDLRLGLLTPDAATARRATLERESQLYGAMDGAMKFVKGDAIASIAISVINLVAGVAIGMSRGMDLLPSLQTYGLLTVGDGLVSQLPALLITASAAIVVTRVASEDAQQSLGRDIATQLFGAPHVLWGVCGLLALLALVPGLPLPPFALVSTIAGTLAWLGSRRGTAASHLAHARVCVIAPSAEAARWSDGAGGIGNSSWQRIARQVFERTGLTVPMPALETGSKRAIRIDGLEHPLAGTHDLENDVVEALCRHASRLFGVEQAQQLVALVARSQPSAVRNLVPTPLSLPALTIVLQRLLDEGVSLRHADRMLDALARVAARETHLGKLANVARSAVQAQLSAELAPAGTIEVLQLDPLLQDALRDAYRDHGDTEQLALAPQLAEDMLQAVRQATAELTKPVLLTPDRVRRATHCLLHRELPGVRVVGVSDLSPDVRVQTIAWIGPSGF